MKTFLQTIIDAANESDCAKRRFGALAIKNGSILGTACNKRLESHAFLCDGECIRMKIDSGTDVMVGACGHAEERLIWSLGKEAEGAEIYVVRTDFNGNIVPRQEKSFYCARCATTMIYAGVVGVNVYVVDHFEFMTTQEAIESAYEFALGKKTA